MRALRCLTLALALALAVPLIAASSTFAGSGKAIIPTTLAYYSNGNNASNILIFLSNISENTVEVTLTLYNKDGNFIYESGSSGQTTGDISAYDVDVSSYTEATSSSAGYTAKFELSSKKSCRIRYYPATSASGAYSSIFGALEWKNKYTTNDDDVALVSTATYTRWSYETARKLQATSYLPINNGMPF
jgi:hypothetical protein